MLLQLYMFYPRFPENVTFYFISIAYKQSNVCKTFYRELHICLLLDNITTLENSVNRNNV